MELNTLKLYKYLDLPNSATYKEVRDKLIELGIGYNPTVLSLIKRHLKKLPIEEIKPLNHNTILLNLLKNELSN